MCVLQIQLEWIIKHGFLCFTNVLISRYVFRLWGWVHGGVNNEYSNEHQCLRRITKETTASLPTVREKNKKPNPHPAVYLSQYISKCKNIHAKLPSWQILTLRVKLYEKWQDYWCINYCIGYRRWILHVHTCKRGNTTQIAVQFFHSYILCKFTHEGWTRKFSCWETNGIIANAYFCSI